jgi:LacI family transcriptional regulator
MYKLPKVILAVESYREFMPEAQAMNTPAVSDSLVAKAVDFIKNNANKQIQVSDVVEHVSVSRRKLERRFKKYLNHSIHQEIKLAKVQLITKMLLETSDSISEIAAKLGFEDIAHIARYFRDVEGISPVEYRKKNLCTV